MVTILEALQNANYNLKGGNPIQTMIAKDQLNNAVTLLEKGYDVDDSVEEIIENYGKGKVEDVPDINS